MVIKPDIIYATLLSYMILVHMHSGHKLINSISHKRLSSVGYYVHTLATDLTCETMYSY